jgi:hypothetical protein
MEKTNRLAALDRGRAAIQTAAIKRASTAPVVEKTTSISRLMGVNQHGGHKGHEGHKGHKGPRPVSVLRPTMNVVVDI